MDRWNYYNDSRVKESFRTRPYTWQMSGNHVIVTFNESIIEDIDDDSLLELFGNNGLEYNQIKCGFSIEICYTCSGKGTVVDPSIDAGGLTHDDFYDDPGFYEDYIGGMYDVSCPSCTPLSGRNIVPNIPKLINKLVNDFIQEENEYLSIRMAELRMGC
tara:strand:+ start:103 stop:579 length:477 start_codon:yes stop_codon:yes gene_type:complete